VFEQGLVVPAGGLQAWAEPNPAQPPVARLEAGVDIWVADRLGEWARVRDWRTGQIAKLQNVQVYKDNRLGAQDVIDFGAQRVVIATGCGWRRDGYGRSNATIAGLDTRAVFTPDDIMDGRLPESPVLLFDDDGGYYGSVVAEALCRSGCEVTFVTPEDSVAMWTRYTLEFAHIQQRLRELGVRIVTSHNLAGWQDGAATLVDVWSGRQQEIFCAALLAVTSRLPEDSLKHELQVRADECRAAGIAHIDCIGDARAPGLIAHAVYAGHRYAREVDEPAPDDVPFRRERVQSERF